MTVSLKEILAGDVRAAARLMRDLDDEIPAAQRVLKRLYRHTGRAYILGITGAPGAGKSTLVDVLIDLLRKDGKTVGIVAIDPTSPFSGGAILGDRIRMQQHTLDEGVFIRSLATRGHMGGLSRSTLDIVNVMDAMGKDVILIETVGVGQDEVDVMRTVDAVAVVTVPGLGDEIQAIKAGIMEIADVFVVNKADREGADKTRRELETMIGMNDHKEGDWIPPVLPSVALDGSGLPELMEAIDRHRRFIYRVENLGRYREGKARVELLEILKNKLIEKAVDDLERHGLLAPLLDGIARKRTDPYSIVEKIVDHSFAFHLIEGTRRAPGKGKKR
jgi:LAO/AO transport system kinase